ncbi:hypothetical protein OZX74_06710 [Bifidobacterium sp. ESL0798]|uniref:hypothetical protein n=1 Tax=Bifidobacterium sp. ESL0798 TaxID=2983235 RepID=UPI0023F88804|nr:hypothetical protein [Bifidobacterium sp. ESL0798]WEV73602.1 hypothetical protein OZX74_06710 [Bifidobacterium sp. ESL0798]
MTRLVDEDRDGRNAYEGAARYTPCRLALRHLGYTGLGCAVFAAGLGVVFLWFSRSDVSGPFVLLGMGLVMLVQVVSVLCAVFAAHGEEKAMCIGGLFGFVPLLFLMVARPWVVDD